MIASNTLHTDVGPANVVGDGWSFRVRGAMVVGSADTIDASARVIVNASQQRKVRTTSAEDTIDTSALMLGTNKRKLAVIGSADTRAGKYLFLLPAFLPLSLGALDSIKQDSSRSLSEHPSASTAAEYYSRTERTEVGAYAKQASEQLDSLCDKFRDHDENQVDVLRLELAKFLTRFEGAGVQAIADRFYSHNQSSEFDWCCIELLGIDENARTASTRLRVLEIALVSRDPAMRYSAAVGLGFFGREAALQVLRDRLPRERNTTVQAMIRAQLSRSS